MTALGIVTDSELEAALSGEGTEAAPNDRETYPRDPFLNAYTGFFVEEDAYPKLPRTPPKFHRNALVALREGT